MNTVIGFKSPMFVYAAESATNPSTIKVFIPEVFLLDKNSNISETKLQKGNTSIFVNAIIPALSTYVNKYNYITLPVVGSGISTTRVDGYSYSGTTGIGSIKKGDRLVAEFINNNPKYGIIVARC